MQEFGIQIEYNIQKERTLHLALRLRGEMQLTDKTISLDVEASDTIDNVKPRSKDPTATCNTWRTRERVRSVAVFVVSLCSAVFTLISCTSHNWLKLKMFACAPHSSPWSSPCCMHELSVLSDFLDFFITFIFLFFFILDLKQVLLPFNFSEVK